MKTFTIYAALLGLILVYLSVRTLRVRRRLKVSIGDSGNPELLRAIRVHGNFTEYTLIALILVFLVEDAQGSIPVIHFLGITFLIGRILHAIGVSKHDEKFVFRVSGMALTFTSILSSRFYCLISSKL